jgi:hypothetical protein
VIYALVLAPALTELLPKSGMAATPAAVGFVGSVLFALFLVGFAAGGVVAALREPDYPFINGAAAPALMVVIVQGIGAIRRVAVGEHVNWFGFLFLIFLAGSCGAVGAAVETLTTGAQADGFVRAVVDRVIPSIAKITGAGNGSLENLDPAVLRREHVRNTVDMLHSYSAGLAAAVAEGRCAIVGVEYDFAEGRAHLVDVVGDVGEAPLADA